MSATRAIFMAKTVVDIRRHGVKIRIKKKAAIFIFVIFGPSYNFLRWLRIQT